MTDAPSLPRWLPPFVWAFSLLVPLLAISNQSLWIDEAITGVAARQPTIATAWQSLRAVSGSDVQMPFYMLYVWLWEKPFGASEISLRLANYPWFVLGQIAGAAIFRDSRKALFFLVAAAANCHLWAYLNEARPYVMQYGIACVLAYLVCSVARGERVTAGKCWLFAAAAFLMAAANMLGTLWVFTAVAVAFFFLWQNRMKPAWLPLIVMMAALAALGLFYIWTLSFGARGNWGKGGILNAGFVAYELLGFAGLGPGRLNLRESRVTALQPFLVPLGLYAAALLVVLWRAAKAWARGESRRPLMALGIFALVPVLVLLVLGLPLHFNVLGRHAMPALPFVVAIISLGLFHSFRAGRIAPRLAAALFLFLAFASCLSLRMLPRHLKDDYRGAAAELRRLLPAGATAWWAASREGGEYYQVEFDDPTADRPGVISMKDPAAGQITTLPAPEVVVLSKLDIYDAHRAITGMLRERGYILERQLPAFTIWRRAE